MKKSHSLGARFATNFSIIIIVFTLIISGIISIDFMIINRNNAGNRLVDKALQMSNILERFIWDRNAELNFISKLSVFKDIDDTKELRRTLDDVQRDLFHYEWIGFLDPNGIVIEDSESILKGENLSKEPIFYKALLDNYLGEANEGGLLGEKEKGKKYENMQLLDVSMPIFSDNGKFLGVLAAYINWNWIAESETTIYQGIEHEKNTNIIIINQEDNVVLYGPDDMSGNKLDLNIINQNDLPKMGWDSANWPDEERYITAYVQKSGFSQQQDTPWIVLARQPVRTVYGYLAKTIEFVVVSGVVSAIVFAIIGLIAANRVTKPLKQLTIASGKLKDGEDVQIPMNHRVKEIELLAESLDSLIKSLVTAKDELGEMTGLANQDGLTNLPNRIALNNYLHDLTAEHDDLNFIMMYLDLDGFKAVNDTYGHHIGDLLLQSVAKRIKTCVASGDLVARIGGDEFVVIVVNNQKGNVRDNGAIVANRIIKEIKKVFMIDNKRIKVGCSVGGAIWKIDSTDITELADMADKALYQSKNSGKGKFTYY